MQFYDRLNRVLIFLDEKSILYFGQKIVIPAIVSNSWICSADSEAKRFNLGDAMYIKVKTFSIQKLVLASSNEWCINLYCDTIFWTYLNLTTMGLNNFCRSVFSLFQLTSESKKPGQIAIVLHYCDLSRFFLTQTLLSLTFWWQYFILPS